MLTYKNPGVIRFQSIILQEDIPGGGAWVEFPYSVEKLFGVKGRVPINASFDGIPYRGSLVKMGGNCHSVLILKKIREQIGKKKGDTINVTIELDDQPRVIELAVDAQRALKKNAAAYSAWKKLSYSHQREFHLWLEGAKKPETRIRRLTKIIQDLAGKSL